MSHFFRSADAHLLCLPLGTEPSTPRLRGNGAILVFGGHFLAFEPAVSYALLPATFCWTCCIIVSLSCFCLRCRLEVVRCRIRLLFHIAQLSIHGLTSSQFFPLWAWSQNFASHFFGSFQKDSIFWKRVPFGWKTLLSPFGKALPGQNNKNNIPKKNKKNRRSFHSGSLWQVNPSNLTVLFDDFIFISVVLRHITCRLWFFFCMEHGKGSTVYQALPMLMNSGRVSRGVPPL